MFHEFNNSYSPGGLPKSGDDGEYLVDISHSLTSTDRFGREVPKFL